MLAFGRRKKVKKTHPHNECDMCTSTTPTKGTARMRLKTIFNKLVKHENT